MFSYGKPGKSLGPLPLAPQGESETARQARIAYLKRKRECLNLCN